MLMDCLSNLNILWMDPSHISQNLRTMLEEQAHSRRCSLQFPIILDDSLLRFEAASEGLDDFLDSLNYPYLYE